MAEIHGTLDRPGCRIHYWLGGPEGAPLVVFTHGAICDHHMFDPQVPAVADRWRILMWDVRGHGRSQPASTFSTAEAAADLSALIEHCGYTQAVLVGQSMGGMISQEVVFTYPERVRGLAIVGSSCITLPLTWAEALGLKLSAPLLRMWPYGPLLRTIASASGLRRETQAYVRTAASHVSHRDFARIWAGVIMAIHPEPGYRITCPLLLTHGDQDATGNIRKIAPVWARRDPLCRYEVIPSARHVANYDNPERFNALLIAFLNSLDGHTPMRDRH
ncbi:MAG TPA: alpha/beta hydrolase [Symbiobacteriaceae bacterium]|nr:alpha/beta hydrolase [Symbiobacteriaceae bacterium]